MLGYNPAAAKAAKLKSDLKNKALSRQYEAFCQSCNMPPMKARLLEPAAAEKGRILRAIENSKRKKAELKAQKDRIAQRFS